jgi:hypothetical protein
MQTRAISQDLKTLTAEAIGLLTELDAIGQDVESKLTVAMDRAWRLGRALASIKAVVGHGNWLVWLDANLAISSRHAQRHMELATANPEAECVGELSVESVRKFRLGYVPEKAKPELPGDATLPRVCHHLTLLNDWRRFTRRVEIGQVNLDAEEARRDLAPLFEWLCELYGRTREPATTID